MNTRLRSHWKWWQRAVAVEKEAGLDVYSPNTVEEANRLFRYGWRLLLEQTPGKRSDGRCHKCKCHLVSSRCPECSQKPSVFPCPRCGLLRWKTQRPHRACLSSKKRINHPWEPQTRDIFFFDRIENKPPSFRISLDERPLRLVSETRLYETDVGWSSDATISGVYKEKSIHTQKNKKRNRTVPIPVSNGMVGGGNTDAGSGGEDKILFCDDVRVVGPISQWGYRKDGSVSDLFLDQTN